MVQCDSVGRRQLSQGLLKPPAVKPQFIPLAMGPYTPEMAQRGTRTKGLERHTESKRGFSNTVATSISRTHRRLL